MNVVWFSATEKEAERGNYFIQPGTNSKPTTPVHINRKVIAHLRVLIIVNVLVISVSEGISDHNLIAKTWKAKVPKAGTKTIHEEWRTPFLRTVLLMMLKVRIGTWFNQLLQHYSLKSMI